jgi:hypothetical protein
VKPPFVARRALALLLLPLLLAMDASSFRFHRKIEGAAGFTEVEISDDVFDAARAGLADLRIVSETGEEIPYLVGGPLAPLPVKLSLFDVEQNDHETTALADRGAIPLAPMQQSSSSPQRSSSSPLPSRCPAIAQRGARSRAGRSSPRLPAPA